MPRQKQTTRIPTQLCLFEASALIQIDPLINPDLRNHIERQVNSGAKTMVRSAVFHPDTIFALLGKNSTPSSDTQVWEVNGIKFNVTPKRLFAFHHTMTCASCDTKGLVFFVEKHLHDTTQAQSLNLYALKNGNLVLITCDHVLPDSFGGRYHMDNFQTMCTVCNNKKANRMSDGEIKLVLDNVTKYAKTWVDREFIKCVLTVHSVANQTTNRNEANELLEAINQCTRKLNFATTSKQYAAMVAQMQILLRQHVRKARSNAYKALRKKIISRTLGILTFGLLPTIQKMGKVVRFSKNI